MTNATQTILSILPLYQRKLSRRTILTTCQTGEEGRSQAVATGIQPAIQCPTGVGTRPPGAGQVLSRMLNQTLTAEHIVGGHRTEEGPWPVRTASGGVESRPGESMASNQLLVHVERKASGRPWTFDLSEIRPYGASGRCLQDDLPEPRSFRAQ